MPDALPCSSDDITGAFHLPGSLTENPIKATKRVTSPLRISITNPELKIKGNKAYPRADFHEVSHEQEEVEDAAWAVVG